MDKDQDIVEKAKLYQELARENKNIDVSALMIDALQNEDANMLTAKEKRIAYLVSLAVPPFGLIYAAKFYFGDKRDGKTAAIVCVVLTIFSIVMGYVLIKVMTSTAGVDINQLQQVPKEYQQLLQN